MPHVSVRRCVRVEDADRLFALYVERGADIVEPIADRPWGMREFTLRDPNGHRFRIGHQCFVVHRDHGHGFHHFPVTHQRRIVAVKTTEATQVIGVAEPSPEPLAKTGKTGVYRIADAVDNPCAWQHLPEQSHIQKIVGHFVHCTRDVGLQSITQGGDVLIVECIQLRHRKGCRSL